jgi:hypothetical protein
METKRGLDKWLAQKQISVNMSRVMCNPNLVDEPMPEALEHFRCRLFKRDRYVDLYLSVIAEDESISPNEALLMLAMDAASCRLLENYEGIMDEWLSDLGESNRKMHTEARTFWKEYAARCSQQSRLRSFLGDSVYDEMLRKAELPTDLTKAS